MKSVEEQLSKQATHHLIMMRERCTDLQAWYRRETKITQCPMCPFCHGCSQCPWIWFTGMVCIEYAVVMGFRRSVDTLRKRRPKRWCVLRIDLLSNWIVMLGNEIKRRYEAK